MLAPRKVLHSTPIEVLEQAFHVLNINSFNEHDVLFDIGCGDARALIYVAQTFGMKCVGIEIDPDRAAEAKENILKMGLESLITIHCGNALEIDLSKATIVYLFLIERGLRKILPILQTIKHPIRVITYLYPIPGERYTQREQCTVTKERTIPLSFPIYLYEFNYIKNKKTK